MYQKLLTVVKRWHLFSTDEFIRLQTKDQCYFAFSEFGTETTLTGKCMHDNYDSYLEWWKSTLTVSNFKNCFWKVKRQVLDLFAMANSLNYSNTALFF